MEERLFKTNHRIPRYVAFMLIIAMILSMLPIPGLSEKTATKASAAEVDSMYKEDGIWHIELNGNDVFCLQGGQACAEGFEYSVSDSKSDISVSEDDISSYLRNQSTLTKGKICAILARAYNDKYISYAEVRDKVREVFSGNNPKYGTGDDGTTDETMRKALFPYVTLADADGNGHFGTQMRYFTDDTHSKKFSSAIAITGGYYKIYSCSEYKAQQLLDIGGKSVKQQQFAGVARQKIRIVKKDENGNPVKLTKIVLRTEIDYENDNESLYQLRVTDSTGSEVTTIGPSVSNDDADESTFKYNINYIGTKSLIRMIGYTDENGVVEFALSWLYKSPKFNTIKEAKDDVLNWMKNFPTKTYYVSETTSGAEAYVINPDFNGIPADGNYAKLDIGEKLELGVNNTAFRKNPRSSSSDTASDFSNSGWSDDYDLSNMKTFSTELVEPYVMNVPLTQYFKSGLVNVVKVSATGTVPEGYSLKGAEFGLYEDAECKTKIETVTTDDNGKATFSIVPNKDYWIREDKAPTGFNNDYEVKHIIWESHSTTDIGQGTDPANYGKYGNVLEDQVFENTLVTGFSIKKSKRYNNYEKPEKEVTFRYYNSSAASYDTCPETERGILITDENGETSKSGQLNEGEYILEQVTTGNNGNDDTIKEDNIKIIVKKINGKLVLYKNSVEKENELTDNILYLTNDDANVENSYYFLLQKKDKNTGKVILKPGNKFKIYRMNMQNDADPDGEYTETFTAENGTEVKCKPITVNGTDVFSTDNTGSILFNDKFEEGRYLIQEVEPSKGNYIVTDSIEVNIRGFQVDENDDVILNADGTKKKTTFKTVTDANGKEYTVIAAEYENDDKYGELTLKKTGSALKSYAFSGVDGIPTSADLYDEVKDFNTSGFSYSETNITGAKFRITAKEDIVSQDGQGTIYAKAGETIYELTTGEASADEIITLPDEAKKFLGYKLNADNTITVNLPLGVYEVEEIEAPEGFTLPDKAKWTITVEDDQKEDSEPIVKATGENVEDGILSVKNNAAKGSVKLIKKDSLTEILIADCVFGLYSADDIYNAAGEKIVSKDQLIELVTSNEKGEAISALKLPVENGINTGKYYFKELKSCDTYYLNSEVVDFTVENKSNTEIVEVEAEMKDVSTAIYIKKAITLTEPESPNEGDNNEPLDGCKLQLTDSKGNVILTWISGDESSIEIGDNVTTLGYQYLNVDYLKDKGMIYISGLFKGETYTVTELEPAPGWTTQKPLVFTVATESSTKKTPVVEWDAEKITLENSVIKMLDMPTDFTFTKKSITGEDEVPGCKLQVVDSQGKVVEEWISTTTPHKIVAKLVVGNTYRLVETCPAPGYTTAESVEFTVLDTHTVQVVEMRDDITKVHITKTDITGEKEVVGAKLSVVASNGAVIDSWTSSTTAHAIEGKLVVGEKYTLIEKRPADGYATADSITFEIKDTGEIQHVTMKDDTTKVHITKTDITGSKEVVGAKLSVVASSGAVVESWTSTATAHAIEAKLIVGETYKLIETKPADGYATAEEIKFKIKDTGEVQHVTMKDDTTKIYFDKIAADTGKLLKGAKYEILDSDGEVVKEFTTNGKTLKLIGELVVGETYTFHEVEAPEGYELAEDVEITIKDTGNVQKIKVKDKKEEIEITDSPQTGYSTILILLLITFFISMAGFLITRKREKLVKKAKKKTE